MHRAIEGYLEPNEFRRFLNSAIQNSRSVTFLVQKRKGKWPDFDHWYGDWQSKARENSVLGWGVTARNRIVKEEDLKTLSEARITLYGERLSAAEDVIVVPPEYTPGDILAVFDQVRDGSRTRRGLVRVQRRWVDDQLPEYELVAALKEMYRGVAEVVRLAHKASGVDELCGIAPFPRSCVAALIEPELRCIGPGAPVPDGLYDLATGERMGFRYGTIERDENLEKVGLERYGPGPQRHSSDPIEHVPERLEYSKRFLLADGYSGPTLVLSREKELRLLSVSFEDDEPRELKIAASVDMVGAWPFTGAVYSSETWLGVPRGSLLGVPPEELLDSNDEYFTASVAAGREEALIVVGLASDGRSRVLIQPFGRTKDGLVWGSLTDDATGQFVPRFMSPIWRNWPSFRTKKSATEQ